MSFPHVQNILNCFFFVIEIELNEQQINGGTQITLSCEMW